ncbi:MAG: hypothetical protein ACOYOB_21535, partial [Myxococcota bacterium]
TATSLLTYRIKKVLTTKRAADQVGCTVVRLTNQRIDEYVVTKRATRQWVLWLKIRDVDLDGPNGAEIRAALTSHGTLYGSETFTSVESVKTNG